MSSLAVFLILGGATAFAASKKIGANEIKANAIVTGKIAKEAVAEGKLKNGAVTAGKLGGGAVSTDKIADNAVTTPKIADNAVTTGKIANDAVTGDKVKESTLSQVPNAANAAKLGGISPSGFLGSTVTVARGSSSVANGARGFVNVPCPSGQQVVGGGVRFETLADGNRVVYDGPAFAGQTTALPTSGSVPTAWQASAVNGSGATDTLFVWAVCASIP
jgi:hypothetical protein